MIPLSFYALSTVPLSFLIVDGSLVLLSVLQPQAFLIFSVQNRQLFSFSFIFQFKT